MSDSEYIEEEPTTLKQNVVTPLIEFYNDSVNLLRKCDKPDRKEFLRVLKATGIGFLVMGGVGFFVKLIHIPINNILVGGA